MAGPRGLKAVTQAPGYGYGDAASEYLAGLDALGVPVTWYPTVANRADPVAYEDCTRLLHDAIKPDVLALWQRPLDCSALLVNVPPYRLHHHWRRQEPDLRAFAAVAWEVETVPETWPDALNPYEAVFVPSTFNRRALTGGGTTAPVEVVPHVARRADPVPGGPAWGQVAEDDFVFYTIGAWTTRKAMDATVRAYLEAFDGSDKVALIVKTDPVDQIALRALPKDERAQGPPTSAMVWWSLSQILADYANPAKVHLIAEAISARDIDRLHTRGDCFVSLSHSEGWGLGSFDAALFGNPVVMTGWGGQLDYLGDDYPFLVRYDLKPTADWPADGGFLQAPDVHWAEADRRHAGELMREVFEKQARAAALARDLAPRLRARFSPETVCRRLAELMGFAVER